MLGIFKTKKALDIAEKGVDGVVKGIDKMFYTDEEKADSYQKRLEIADKIANTHIKLVEATADENSERSTTRRIVAIMILAFSFVSMISIVVIRFFNKDIASFALQVVKDFEMPYLTLIVGIFFFGNHMINRIKAK